MQIVKIILEINIPVKEWLKLGEALSGKVKSQDSKVTRVVCYSSTQPCACSYNIFSSNDRNPNLSKNNRIYYVRLHVQRNSSIHFLLPCLSTSYSSSSKGDHPFHEIFPVHMRHNIRTMLRKLDCYLFQVHTFHRACISRCNTLVFCCVWQAEKRRIRLPPRQKTGKPRRVRISFCRRKIRRITHWEWRIRWLKFQIGILFLFRVFFFQLISNLSYMWKGTLSCYLPAPWTV